jgi:hypothetical protein
MVETLMGKETPIELFPSLTMTDEFFAEAASIIPKVSSDYEEETFEGYFCRWIKIVKKFYPTECREYVPWLKAALILIVEYGNILYNFNLTSDYRNVVFDWILVDEEEEIKGAWKVKKRCRLHNAFDLMLKK